MKKIQLSQDELSVWTQMQETEGRINNWIICYERCNMQNIKGGPTQIQYFLFYF